MAEVSPRLFGTGFSRLIVFRTNLNRPVCVDRGSECLLIHGSRSLAQQKSTHDPVVSKSKATQRTPKKDLNQQTFATLFGSSFDLPSSSWICCADSRKRLQAFGTTWSISTGPLQGKLLACKMSSWTRGVVFIHHDTFRSPQQVRAFCAVLFVRTENESVELNCGHLNFHPRTVRASAPTRSYCRRSEAHLLHRSKTSYYDILKVSSGATQSQIKTAYYKQSFIHHPDKNQGSTKANHRFSEISEAYAVLGNTSLRRRYDRGLLRHSDIQSAGRPTSKETKSRSTGSQQQQRVSRFSHVDGKPIFDFDAFYQAHYGEQLQRERVMRARRKQMEEMQKKINSRKQHTKIELVFAVLVMMAGVISLSLLKP
ncbi:dnaJ (Hsp40) homolog, subfamily C, member 30b [Nothobranchius furzeri]|uniref:DnaJ (Hsp40) homolog, subfamily C, member 30 n=1 Tax=Nothobranchius furzeri TaxID=105023 RepID=A0A1A8U2G1_NOTFU|nr:dnaJ (Hsp40) homolog, subfamily C, member 30b [Nothobranchius furzeri]KAF7218841.1 DnaJ heat shock protein family (Hsp40) member C30 [Nothobranchius furzeri]